VHRVLGVFVLVKGGGIKEGAQGVCKGREECAQLCTAACRGYGTEYWAWFQARIDYNTLPMSHQAPCLDTSRRSAAEKSIYPERPSHPARPLGSMPRPPCVVRPPQGFTMMENESSYLLETRRKVRDQVRALRPVPNLTPQQSAASQRDAAYTLAGLFSRQPETRQLFLAEGGVLAALELLDAELARVAEAGLEVLRAFTASDTRLLESLCLVGLVPAVVRMAAAGGALSSSSWQQLSGPSGGSYGAGSAAAGKDGLGGGSMGAAGGAAAAAGGGGGGGMGAGGVGALGLGGPPSHSGSSAELTHLRRKAAGFVVQLCFAKETTLQMFIACGGLRCLVVMVQDNLQDVSTLTPVAVACVWQVLETYGALPINYICRIFASSGLVQRLYAVIKQLINLNRQQQQQQQRGGGGGYGAAAAAVAGGQGSVGAGLKLQHLNCPLTPQGLPFATADFFPLAAAAAAAGRDAPQAAGAAGGGDSSDATGGSLGAMSPGAAASVKGGGKGLGGRKGSPVVESGLAGGW